MKQKELMQVVSETLKSSYTALLTSIDTKGRPASRWMTPTVLDSGSGLIYSICSRNSDKCHQIEENPAVQWLIQTRTLTRIITVNGEARLLDNPRLKAEVLEAIGPHLNIFWQVYKDPAELLVIETRMTDGSIYHPLKNEHFDTRDTEEAVHGD